MGIILKAQIKYNLKQNIKPTKKIRNLPPKKDVKVLRGSQGFSGDLAGKRWWRWWFGVEPGRRVREMSVCA